MIKDLPLDPSHEWDRFFPQEFEFYHLGKVRISDARSPFFGDLSRDSMKHFAYHLSDPNPMLMILSYPASEDASVYSELGNILACRLARGSWVSPPQSIHSTDRLGKSQIERMYIQEQRDKVIHLLVKLYFVSKEEGHA